MRGVEHDARKDESEEPSIQGTKIRHPQYAEETVLFSTTLFSGLEKIIKSVKEHSDKKGLHPNVKKTKIMDTDKCEKEAVIQFDEEKKKS